MSQINPRKVVHKKGTCNYNRGRSRKRQKKKFNLKKFQVIIIFVGKPVWFMYAV